VRAWMSEGVGLRVRACGRGRGGGKERGTPRMRYVSVPKFRRPA
jgi:hypothetical protein